MLHLLNHLLLLIIASMAGVICWKNGFRKTAILAFLLLESGYLVYMSGHWAIGTLFVIPGALLVLWTGQRKAPNLGSTNLVDALSTTEMETHMGATFRRQDGTELSADPTSLTPHFVVNVESSAKQDTGSRESASLLRKKIEDLIRMSGSDPERAALEICVMLDEHLDLAANGWFDNDEATQKAILASDEG